MKIKAMLAAMLAVFPFVPVAAGASPAATPAPVAVQADACSALKSLASTELAISSAEHLSAGPLALPNMFGPPTQIDLPAACVVKGVIAPRTAHDGRTFGVGFEMRLPDAWNGRFLFQGGGGLDGAVNPALGLSSSGPPALARGFAVVSMDGGHEGRDASFASDQQAKLDFAYQAVGKTTTTAKAIIRAYYRKAPDHAYFVGCSNGGREALMAVQRYPLEFDGIVAGAPGYRLTRAAIQEAFAVRELAKIAPKRADGQPDLARAITDEDLKLVSDGVLKTCDAQDGLADGLVSDPKSCRFSARSLVCKPGQAQACLTAQKADVLDAIFGGAKDSAGRAIYSRFYWDSGVSQTGWRMWMMGIADRIPALNLTLGADSLANYFMSPAQPGRNPYEIDLDHAVEQTAQTAAINDAVSTGINSFTGHGGKLILYHGVADPVFSAADTVNWFEAVRHDEPSSAEAVRLFLVPGMNHCSGGATTDSFDMLGAIQAWVEDARAPDSIIASGKASLPGVTRPLCAFPTYAKYQGGDVKSAASFRCTSGEAGSASMIK